MLPHLLEVDLCQEEGGVHEQRAREWVCILGTGSSLSGSPTSSTMCVICITMGQQFNLLYGEMGLFICQGDGGNIHV